MILFLSLFLIYTPAEVLVLKNGKTISCISYQVSAGQVTIKSTRETFVLPEKLIDWERSKVEKNRRDQAAIDRKKAADEARVRELAEARKKARPKKDVILTNDNYEQKVGVRKNGKTTIPYTTLGNSILVKATLNGQGPFDILLDTGASITLISPQIAQQLGLARGETRKLVGVGGQAVTAHSSILNSVSLGGAEVKGLNVTIRGIDQLNNYSVVGLLGQDFFNHFTMELNPTNKTVTLERSGMGDVLNKDVESLANFMKKPDKAFQQLRSITRELGDYLGIYMNLSSGNPDARDMKRVRELAHEAPTVSNEMNRTWDHLSKIPEKNSDPQTQERIKKLLACKGEMEAYTLSISQFASTLRSAYSNASNKKKMSQYKAELAIKRNEVNAALQKYYLCLQ